MKKFWAGFALLSVEMIIVITICLVSMVAFVTIARKIFLNGNEELDVYINAEVSRLVSPVNTSVMQFITFFGTHKFLIPANLVLIAFFLFVRKLKWYSIKIPAIAISSLLMMFGLKNLFGRERPEIPLVQAAQGLSFPSGHALMSMTFYGLLIYFIWQSVKNKWLKYTLCLILFIWIQLIGFSRIYLKVHYPTDVMAGYAIGFLWLVVSIWILNRLEKFSQRKLNRIVKEPAPGDLAPQVNS